jgi:hypothetical protein
MVNVVIDIDKEIEMIAILFVVLSVFLAVAVFGGVVSSSVKSLG